MSDNVNDILKLQGHFEQRRNPGVPGPRNLPAGHIIESSHLKKLKSDLESVKEYWKGNNFFSSKVLISVYYNSVVAKSNRIQVLLADRGHVANDSIVGAKFSDDNNHIITHFVDKETIDKTINILDQCILILEEKYNCKLSYSQINSINKSKIKYKDISKTKFICGIVDAYHVEKFDVDLSYKVISDRTIVTLYKTDIEIPALMNKLGFANGNYQLIDDTTLILNPDQFSVLCKEVPFLIAMQVSDISKLTDDDVLQKKDLEIDEDPDFPVLPPPVNEPVVGVIDTQFDEHVYFKEWVEYHNELKDFERDYGFKPSDYDHGTMVTSIIVDGPGLNPRLEDNCGRFRVRHFGVAIDDRLSSSSIMAAIEKIVAENKDIKVWNLSLGSDLEIQKNFISPEAAILDKLQFENDIVFVVSGTNDNRTKKENPSLMKIGAPADSINSIVVNSVDFDNNSADYSRSGPVLSFFNKPDVSYYGGILYDEINVYAPYGKRKARGTSFAAPWITRKMAYLIYKMGLSREVAKALLIDSAVGWKKKKEPSNILGFGIVPVDIMDIVKSKKDEIRFTFSASSEEFDTYNYNIPVPIYQDMQPFIARATLCYFPKCSRNQGVDYTDTELDLHFGRIKGEKEIKSIDNNIQSDDNCFLVEEKARRLYRKWDNIKVIGEEYKENLRGRKLYGDGRWGISLKTKERLSGNAGKGLKFGVVITLKEINGVNRIDEFIRLCSLRGWIVNRVNVENQIDIYNKAEEEIHFE